MHIAVTESLLQGSELRFSCAMPRSDPVKLPVIPQSQRDSVHFRIRRRNEVQSAYQQS